jgi:hypothetical protein
VGDESSAEDEVKLGRRRLRWGLSLLASGFVVALIGGAVAVVSFVPYITGSGLHPQSTPAVDTIDGEDGWTIAVYELSGRQRRAGPVTVSNFGRTTVRAADVVAIGPQGEVIAPSIPTLLRQQVGWIVLAGLGVLVSLASLITAFWGWRVRTMYLRRRPAAPAMPPPPSMP